MPNLPVSDIWKRASPFPRVPHLEREGWVTREIGAKLGVEMPCAPGEIYFQSTEQTEKYL